MSIPIIRTACTLFYSGAGALAPGVAAGAKSVLFLVPVPAAAASAEAAAATALGVASAHVPVDAPAGLSRRTADACVAALASLPRPVRWRSRVAAARATPSLRFTPNQITLRQALVLCASGGRASAVIAIAEGRAGKWSSADTLAWAHKMEMPFLAVQPLRDWVVASVDVRSVRRAALAALPHTLNPSGPRPPQSRRRGPLHQIPSRVSSAFREGSEETHAPCSVDTMLGDERQSGALACVPRARRAAYLFKTSLRHAVALASTVTSGVVAGPGPTPASCSRPGRPC